MIQPGLTKSNQRYRWRLPSLARYVTAVAGWSLTAIAMYELYPYAEHSVLMLAWPAITLTTWYIGPKTGLVCSVLVLAAYDFFLLTPPYTLGIGNEHITEVIIASVGFTTSVVLTAIVRHLQMRAAHEREHLLAVAESARREAERQNALRLGFLAIISHELRTPLTSIKGFATTLLSEDVIWDQEAQRDFLRIIDGEADKLTDMIEQLLDLSRIEAGTLRMEMRPTAPQEIVAMVQPELQAITPQHHLVTEVASDLPSVHADRQRIAQVLANLVGNAVKYSPPGTTIRIHVTREDMRGEAQSSPQIGAYVRFSVIDQGPGIAPQDRPYVFEAYQRGSDRTARMAKGAGLGLAICKAIVEAHHGRIWIEEQTGPGTTISFTLPLDD